MNKDYAKPGLAEPAADADVALAVKPAFDEDAARKKLEYRSPFLFMRRVKMERVELVLMPHYLFTLHVRWKDNTEQVLCAVDAVLGNFARWDLDPAALDPADETSSLLDFSLTRDEARAKLTDQYRWVLIGAGLKLRRKYRVESIEDGPRVYFPFYAGIHRSGGKYSIEVIDGLSGMRQGGKVRDPIVAAWMASRP